MAADRRHNDGDDDGQQGSSGSAAVGGSNSGPVLSLSSGRQRCGDSDTVVMVSITVVDILQTLKADKPQLLAPRVDTAVNVLVGTARARSSCHLGVSPAWASSRHISC